MLHDRPLAVDAPFVGLAPFLRQSIAGADLRPFTQALLESAQADPDNPDVLMNLAIAMHCVGNPEFGLLIQEQALEIKTCYVLPARRQPARLRLLMLMAPGDLAANTPLECLLEDTDIDLIQVYLLPQAPSLDDLPPHDVLLVAMSEVDSPLLRWLTTALADWPTPVINAPQRVPSMARDTASRLLQNVPGLAMPLTCELSRASLLAVASGSTDLPAVAPGHRFPLILRPVGSQAGRDLERIDSPAALSAYLGKVAVDRFYLADFIDYSGADGLFRKMRVVLVDGRPFAAHMAVSSHWMVHYVNAGMYEEAAKREEEAVFMSDFEPFARRHEAALLAIHQRTGLDYLAVDCAETADGQLLIFEVDNTMVVHGMDSEELFPYKRVAIQRVVDAFRDMLFARVANHAVTSECLA